MKRIAVLTSLLLAAGCTAETPAKNGENCENEAVIMVVAGETLDRVRMGQYVKALSKSGLYPIAGGYYLNNPRPAAVFEGNVSDNFVTLMVRFPSLEAAKTFWNSDVYQNDIRPIRLNPSAGDYTVTVYAESDLPDYMQGKVADGNYSCP